MIGAKFIGVQTTVRISVFKANKVTFSDEESKSSLFKFISLLAFLQELEIQDVALRENDVESLCEELGSCLVCD